MPYAPTFSWRESGGTYEDHGEANEYGHDPWPVKQCCPTWTRRRSRHGVHENGETHAGMNSAAELSVDSPPMLARHLEATAICRADHPCRESRVPRCSSRCRPMSAG